jgi:excisionase family DNA binding protein
METSQNPENPEKFLTTHEAADRLRVHDETVRRWITHHGCPALSTGGSWRLRFTELEAWLRQRGEARRHRAANP